MQKHAVKWLTVAADANHVPAMVKIATFYRFGRAELRNKVLDREWFQKAADFGDASAHNVLGIQDFFGQERQAFNIAGEKNVERGLSHLKTSAAKRYADAQHFLGGLYANGKEVPLNIERSFALYEQASIQGHRYASEALIKIHSAQKDSTGKHKKLPKLLKDS